MHDGLTPPHISNVVKNSIPSKPRLSARFGLNMIKCAFTSPPTKMGVKGKATNRKTAGQKYRRTS